MDPVVDWILKTLKPYPPNKTIPILEQLSALMKEQEANLIGAKSKMDDINNELDKEIKGQTAQHHLIALRKNYHAEVKRNSRHLLAIWRKTFPDQKLEAEKNQLSINDMAKSFRQSQLDLQTAMSKAGIKIDIIDVDGLASALKDANESVNRDLFASIRKTFNPLRSWWRLFLCSLRMHVVTILQWICSFVAGCLIFILAGYAHEIPQEGYIPFLMIPAIVVMFEYVIHGFVERAAERSQLESSREFNTLLADEIAGIYNDDFHAKLTETIIPAVRKLYE